MSDWRLKTKNRPKFNLILSYNVILDIKFNLIFISNLVLIFFYLLLIKTFFQFNHWEFDFNLFLCQIWSMFFLLLFFLFWIPFFFFLFSKLILYHFFSWEIFFAVFSLSIGLVPTSCSRSWVSKVNTGCLQSFL